jgi:hypothetical protein
VTNGEDQIVQTSLIIKKNEEMGLSALDITSGLGFLFSFCRCCNSSAVCL